MNKDEMIKDKEQMARIIAFDLCPQRYHKELYGENAKCYSDNNFGDCAKIKGVVDKLYNAGYRKVAEDEIVESMKTYERARQETARKILQDIMTRISSFEVNGLKIKSVDLNIEYIKTLANKYGIELE